MMSHDERSVTGSARVQPATWRAAEQPRAADVGREPDARLRHREPRALGDDAHSEEMLRGWEEEGVKTSLVLRMPGRVPGLYLIQTDENGERRFSYWRDQAPVRQLFEQAETPRPSSRCSLSRPRYRYLEPVATMTA